MNTDLTFKGEIDGGISISEQTGRLINFDMGLGEKKKVWDKNFVETVSCECGKQQRQSQTIW